MRPPEPSWEHPMRAPVLDRVPSRPDEKRATVYSAAPLVDPRGPRSYSWPVPFILDQGREGACVGHGCTSEAAATPVAADLYGRLQRGKLPEWAGRTKTRPGEGIPFNDRALAQAFAFDLYDRARDIDAWPGRDYDGTSADAGAKAMREAGLWDGWRWARTALDSSTVVSRTGPIVLALDWWTGMLEPDANGMLHMTGQVEGGHCILARGYSIRRAAFLLPNSWGTDWGLQGEAWLPEEILADQLASGRGEAMIPVGRHR